MVRDMLHHNSPDKLNLGLEGGVVYRAAPGTSRVLMGVGPVTEENQQNYRIQQAVNRYNNVPLPHLRPSTLFKCSLLKSKTAKPANTEQSTAVNVNRTKPETRYAAGHFPTVILGKANIRQAKRNNVLSHLRANEPVLPISRFLDDTSDKYTDMKNTRSVLDVLQDLSRKRIHGKDDGDDVSKRRCKGLGGDQVQEGESFYKPLFVSKAKNNHIVRKDQTTQTQTALALNGIEEATATPVDPKSELRKKLARKNNEIFASLSSSINSVFFPKRKRVQSHMVEKEIHSAKKQKNEVKQKPVEMEMTPVTAAPEKPLKKIEIAASPPAKDRLMSIYFDLKNAGEVKRNVLETLQKSPGESQFRRSFECPPETVSVPSEKITTLVPEKAESSVTATPSFSSMKPAEIDSQKPASDETPKKQATLDQSPVSSVSFKFLNDTSAEKTKPEKPTATEKPSFSFGSLKPDSAKETVTIPAPSFKFGSSNDEPKSPAVSYKFGDANQVLSTPEVLKSSPSKSTDEAKTLPASQSKPLTTGLTFSPSMAGTPPTLSNFSPSSFNFGTKKTEDAAVTAKSQPAPVPTAELPKFNFGTTATTSLFQASSTFNKKPDTTDSTTGSPAFSFGLKTGDSKAAPATPSFSFGPAKTDNPVTTAPSQGFALAPSLSFGPPKPAATDSSAKFPFEETKSKTTVANISFGQAATSTPFPSEQSKPEPATFNFGQNKTTETSPAGFSFAPSKSDSVLKPAFAFGQGKPTDSQGKSDGTTSATSSPSFSFSQTQPIGTLRSGFSFSQAGTTATATSGFSFNTSPTECTNSGFSFGATSSKPFSFGNKTSGASLKEEDAKGSGATAAAGAIFSFGNKSTDVKPAQFGAPSVLTSEPGKETFGSSIFGQQAGNTANSSASPSVFSRLGSTVNTEIKTDSPGDPFKTPTTTDSNSFGESKAAAGSLFKPADNGVPSIFGQTPASAAKSTFSFGQGTTTAPPAYNAPTNPVTTAASTFAQTSGFNFGAKTTSGPTGQSFSFGKTTNAPTAQAFSFGASTSTSAFGAVSFGSAAPTPTAFGSSTTTAPPAFGSSSTVTPSFGSTTTAPPAFGSSSTATPSFGSTTAAPPAFGSSTTATPSFGSITTAPPAFGSSVTSTSTPSFGSTNTAPPPFGSSAALSFGSTTTAPPAFGSSAPSTATPSFGSTGNAPPPFGSSANTSGTPSFGSTSTAPPAFGSSAASMATPSFGSSAAAPPAFGSPAAPTSAPSFRATTTAPPAYGGTAPNFGTVAPAFGSTSATFGTATTTAPPAFGTTTTPAFGSNAFGASSAFSGNSTAPSFGTSAFGSTAPPTFGNPTEKPAFGSGTSGFPAAASTPTFGASTSTSPPQYGNGGFGENSAAFGSANNSGFGAGFANPTPGFGSASSAGTPAPFNFGSGNATSTPTFKFGANANQNAPFTFGSSNNSGSGFNFSASPGGAFSFGSNASGFSQTPQPGTSGFQPGFGQTAPAPFAPSATFSIGTASTQPPRRHMARSRRRP